MNPSTNPEPVDRVGLTAEEHHAAEVKRVISEALLEGFLVPHPASTSPKADYADTAGIVHRRLSALTWLAHAKPGTTPGASTERGT